MIEYNLICDLGVRKGISAEFPGLTAGYGALENNSNLSKYFISLSLFKERFIYPSIFNQITVISIINI